jgi:uncharacterized membrane protein YfcA
MSLPLGLTIGPAAALGAAFFLAAFVRGYSGFGFSALVVAFAGLVTNPVFLVPVVVLCEIAMTTVQTRGILPLIDWRRLRPMLLGAAIAMPVSVTILAKVGQDPARLAISLFILAMCLLLLTGWTLKRTIGKTGHIGVGLVSGVANGAAVGGLPVAAFMAAQPISAPVFRATMIAYLTAIDLIALPIMWANGLVTKETAVIFVMVIPLLAMGIWLGGRRFLSASPQSFRRMAIGLLLMLSVLGLLKSVI